MDVLFLSERGASLPLAKRLAERDHEVAMWIRDRDAQHVGLGIVPIIPVWEPLAETAGLVLVDDILLEYLQPKLSVREIKPLALWGETGPTNRWATIVETGLGMPPTMIMLLAEVFRPGPVPALVHFLHSKEPSKIVYQEDWPSLRSSFPSDQMIAAVQLPGNLRVRVTGLVKNREAVQGSLMLCFGSGAWTFAMPCARTKAAEAFERIATKIPVKDYAGPLTVFLLASDVGWLVADWKLWFQWDLVPVLMRSIREDALYILKMLAAENAAFAVTNLEKYVFLIKVEAPPQLTEDQRGLPLPGIVPKLPAQYHPNGVYHEEGFYKFAGFGRDLGCRSASADSVANLGDAVGIKAVTFTPIEEAIAVTVAKMRELNLL